MHGGRSLEKGSSRSCGLICKYVRGITDRRGKKKEGPLHRDLLFHVSILSDLTLLARFVFMPLLPKRLHARRTPLSLLPGEARAPSSCSAPFRGKGSSDTEQGAFPRPAPTQLAPEGLNLLLNLPLSTLQGLERQFQYSVSFARHEWNPFAVNCQPARFDLDYYTTRFIPTDMRSVRLPGTVSLHSGRKERPEVVALSKRTHPSGGYARWRKDLNAAS